MKPDQTTHQEPSTHRFVANHILRLNGGEPATYAECGCGAFFVDPNGLKWHLDLQRDLEARATRLDAPSEDAVKALAEVMHKTWGTNGVLDTSFWTRWAGRVLAALPPGWSLRQKGEEG